MVTENIVAQEQTTSDTFTENAQNDVDIRESATDGTMMICLGLEAIVGLFFAFKVQHNLDLACLTLTAFTALNL